MRDANAGWKLDQSGFFRRMLIMGIVAVPMTGVAALTSANRPWLFFVLFVVFVIAVSVSYRWSAARLRDAGLFKGYPDLIFRNWITPFGGIGLIRDLYHAPSATSPPTGSIARQEPSADPPHFQVGDRVVHASLGEGFVERVISVDGDLAVLFTSSGKVYPMNSRYLSMRDQ